jgi:hypothetical protein
VSLDQSEAALLPYTLNSFSFIDTVSLYVFARYISPTQLHAIKWLKLFTLYGGGMMGDSSQRGFDFLTQFRGVEVIDVVDLDMIDGNTETRGQAIRKLVGILRSQVPDVRVWVCERTSWDDATEPDNAVEYRSSEGLRKAMSV